MLEFFLAIYLLSTVIAGYTLTRLLYKRERYITLGEAVRVIATAFLPVMNSVVAWTVLIDLADNIVIWRRK